ncbi:RNA recognition motif domain [Trinorchestia longiramus]|nr:RNA recognition motif domain [Trinorchestia longiramus]
MGQKVRSYSLILSYLQNLYDSFVSARERGEKGEVREVPGEDSLNPSGPTTPTRGGGQGGGRHPSSGDGGAPRSGHTIYIFGYNISEEVIKKTFSSFGNILNISMEVDNNCGFVTFEKVDCAEKAIAEMNGSMVSGVQLKVSLARRQPPIEPLNDASSSATWSTIAASHSQKGSHVDKRDLVMYDEDYF